MTNKRTILVTVGTTKFDELIQAVDNPEFLKAVKSKGYHDLLIQKGNGEYVPQHLSASTLGDMNVELFDYKPNLAATIQSSDLVISHAGSGSIFESLSSGKPMIVIPNARLMDNHQVELAEMLTRMKHLVYATPDTLVQVFRDFDPQELKPYQKGSAEKTAGFISSALGL